MVVLILVDCARCITFVKPQSANHARSRNPAILDASVHPMKNIGWLSKLAI